MEIGAYSGPKTTVGIRLAMDEGDGYERILSLKSPVSAEDRERLTIYKMKKAIDAKRDQTLGRD